MRVDILTLFPDMFGPALEASMLGIASDKGAVEFRVHNLRDYTTDAHRAADDKPYGGGPGMVMLCEPVYRAVEAIEAEAPARPRRIALTPQGRRFDQALARELAAEERLLLLCGHYEGMDERIVLGLQMEEVSVGDYVLTGGEIPAMLVADAVTRLLPGALGNAESNQHESFSDGLLGFPQYTRPAEFRGMKTPAALLSGDHQKVALWRAEQARLRTARRRPDLLINRG